MQNIVVFIDESGTLPDPNDKHIIIAAVGAKTPERIAKEEINIFILSIDKMGRKIQDNYENYAILCWLLLEDVFGFYKEVWQIISDRHFSKRQDINSFNSLLADLLCRKLKVVHVDSKKNKKVNIADMIAGAVLAKETGKEQRFYKLMKNKIVSERRLNWPAAKRRLFEQ